MSMLKSRRNNKGEEKNSLRLKKNLLIVSEAWCYKIKDLLKRR